MAESELRATPAAAEASHVQRQLARSGDGSARAAGGIVGESRRSLGAWLYARKGLPQFHVVLRPFPLPLQFVALDTG
jgi:hypothetical protein